MDSTDSDMYIPTGRGLNNPHPIYTDPKIAMTMTHSDTGDSKTEEL